MEWDVIHTLTAASTMASSNKVRDTATAHSRDLMAQKRLEIGRRASLLRIELVSVILHIFISPSRLL